MSKWHEYPLWVPFDEGQLAAVLTTPDHEPQALVLLLQGAGALRSHRNGLWTRTARSLAERGLACVRFDYPQVGDSTGDPRLDWDSPPIEEARAVAETAAAILSVNNVMVVGNCLGARTGFAIASQMQACTGVASILLAGGGGALMTSSRKSKGVYAVRRILRRIKLLRTLVVRVRTATPPRKRHFHPDVERAIRSMPCLFLLIGTEEWANTFEGAVQGVTIGGAATIGGPQVVRVPSDQAKGMRLRPDLQQVVVGRLVDWLARTSVRAGAIREPVSPETS